MKYANLDWQIFPLAAGFKAPLAGSTGLPPPMTASRSTPGDRRTRTPTGMACGEASGVIVDFDPGLADNARQAEGPGQGVPDTVDSDTPWGGARGATKLSTGLYGQIQRFF